MVYTVDMVYTVYMVYTIDMVDTVDLVYAVEMLYSVNMVYTVVMWTWGMRGTTMGKTGLRAETPYEEKKLSHKGVQ